MSKYRLSVECTEDNLTTIRVRLFEKDFVNNIIEISPIQIIIDSRDEIDSRLVKSNSHVL
jgi:hypothetical protein